MLLYPALRGVLRRSLTALFACVLLQENFTRGQPAPTLSDDMPPLSTGGGMHSQRTPFVEQTHAAEPTSASTRNLGAVKTGVASRTTTLDPGELALLQLASAAALYVPQPSSDSNTPQLARNISSERRALSSISNGGIQMPNLQRVLPASDDAARESSGQRAAVDSLLREAQRASTSSVVPLGNNVSSSLLAENTTTPLRAARQLGIGLFDTSLARTCWPAGGAAIWSIQIDHFSPASTDYRNLVELVLTTADGTNIGPRATTAVSSEYGNGYSASRLIDGNLNTMWVSATGDTSAWVQTYFDRGLPAVRSLAIYLRKDCCTTRDAGDTVTVWNSDYVIIFKGTIGATVTDAKGYTVWSPPLCVEQDVADYKQQFIVEARTTCSFQKLANLDNVLLNDATYYKSWTQAIESEHSDYNSPSFWSYLIGGTGYTTSVTFSTARVWGGSANGAFADTSSAFTLWAKCPWGESWVWVGDYWGCNICGDASLGAASPNRLRAAGSMALTLATHGWNIPLKQRVMARSCGTLTYDYCYDAWEPNFRLWCSPSSSTSTFTFGCTSGSDWYYIEDVTGVPVWDATAIGGHDLVCLPATPPYRLTGVVLTWKAYSLSSIGFQTTELVGVPCAACPSGTYIAQQCSGGGQTVCAYPLCDDGMYLTRTFSGTETSFSRTADCDQCVNRFSEPGARLDLVSVTRGSMASASYTNYNLVGIKGSHNARDGGNNYYYTALCMMDESWVTGRNYYPPVPIPRWVGVVSQPFAWGTDTYTWTCAPGFANPADGTVTFTATAPITGNLYGTTWYGPSPSCECAHIRSATQPGAPVTHRCYSTSGTPAGQVSGAPPWSAWTWSFTYTATDAWGAPDGVALLASLIPVFPSRYSASSSLSSAQWSVTIDANNNRITFTTDVLTTVSGSRATTKLTFTTQLSGDGTKLNPAGSTAWQDVLVGLDSMRASPQSRARIMIVVGKTFTMTHTFVPVAGYATLDDLLSATLWGTGATPATVAIGVDVAWLTRDCAPGTYQVGAACKTCPAQTYVQEAHAFLPTDATGATPAIKNDVSNKNGPCTVCTTKECQRCGPIDPTPITVKGWCFADPGTGRAPTCIAANTPKNVAYYNIMSTVDANTNDQCTACFPDVSSASFTAAGSSTTCDDGDTCTFNDNCGGAPAELLVVVPPIGSTAAIRGTWSRGTGNPTVYQALVYAIDATSGKVVGPRASSRLVADGSFSVNWAISAADTTDVQRVVVVIVPADQNAPMTNDYTLSSDVRGAARAWSISSRGTAPMLSFVPPPLGAVSDVTGTWLGANPTQYNAVIFVRQDNLLVGPKAWAQLNSDGSFRVSGWATWNDYTWWWAENWNGWYMQWQWWEIDAKMPYITVAIVPKTTALGTDPNHKYDAPGGFPSEISQLNVAALATALRATAGVCAGTPGRCLVAIHGVTDNIATCEVCGKNSCTLTSGCVVTRNGVRSCGCKIAGTCYGDGDLNPNNECQQCTALLSQSDWSPTVVKSCNDGLLTTTDDTCTGSAPGKCVGTPYTCTAPSDQRPLPSNCIMETRYTGCKGVHCSPADGCVYKYQPTTFVCLAAKDLCTPAVTCSGTTGTCGAQVTNPAVIHFAASTYISATASPAPKLRLAARPEDTAALSGGMVPSSDAPRQPLVPLSSLASFADGTVTPYSAPLVLSPNFTVSCGRLVYDLGAYVRTGSALFNPANLKFSPVPATSSAMPTKVLLDGLTDGTSNLFVCARATSVEQGSVSLSACNNVDGTGWTIDTSAPIPGTVVNVDPEAGTAIPVAAHRGAAIAFTWTSWSDPTGPSSFGGVLNYTYTVIGVPIGRAVGYTFALQNIPAGVNAGSANTAPWQNMWFVPDSYSYSVSVTGYNRAGLQSTVSAAKVIVDRTGPERIGAVTSGNGFVTKTTALLLSWQGVFQDLESGIAYFSVALGLSAGAQDVSSWLKLTNTATNYTFSSVAWRAGQRYFATVRATSGSGAWTDVSGPPQLYDDTPPVVGATLPPWSVPKYVLLSVSFVEPQTDVAYWTATLGTAEGASDLMAKTTFTTLLPNGGTVSLPLPVRAFADGQSVYACVNATNTAGLQTASAVCAVTQIDELVPVVTGVYSLAPGTVPVAAPPSPLLLANSRMELLFSWGPCYDTHEGQSIVSYQVRIVTNNALTPGGGPALGPSPTGPIALSDTNVGLATSISLPNGAYGMTLVPGYTYWPNVTCFTSTGMANYTVGAGVTIDVTPPDISAVSLGTVVSKSAVAWPSLTTITASWTVADAESRVSGVEWAVGACGPVASQSVFQFKSVEVSATGATASASGSGWSLSQGHFYCIWVRATNIAGLVSTASSPPWLVDSTPPQVTSTVRDGVWTPVAPGSAVYTGSTRLLQHEAGLAAAVSVASAAVVAGAVFSGNASTAHDTHSVLVELDAARGELPRERALAGLIPTFFWFTGNYQYVTVPGWASAVNVYMWGAGGDVTSWYWTPRANGGGGAYVAGTLAVTPGTQLRIIVGRGATSYYTYHRRQPDAQGGGGGSGGYCCGNGGSGGGRSAVQVYANGAWSEAATAAGGGGAYTFGGCGFYASCCGGAGGLTYGQTGGDCSNNQAYTSDPSSANAAAGCARYGGGGGPVPHFAPLNSAGDYFTGGMDTGGSFFPGGGGGWVGGDAGGNCCCAGAGGGSSLLTHLSNTAASEAGNVRIPGGLNAPYYAMSRSAGWGGTSDGYRYNFPGRDGFVVLEYVPTWTLNGAATWSDSYGYLPIQLTPNKFNQAGSAFLTAPVIVDAFSVSFSFTIAGSGDGIMFVIEKTSMGASFLGGSNGQVGYGSAQTGTQSLALGFKTYSSWYWYSRSTIGLVTRGSVAGELQYPDPFNFMSGNVFSVDVRYSQSTNTFAATVKDNAPGGATKTYSWSVDLRSILDCPPISSNPTPCSAWIGATAATGGSSAQNTLRTFSYVYGVTSPTASVAASPSASTSPAATSTSSLSPSRLASQTASSSAAASRSSAATQSVSKSASPTVTSTHSPVGTPPPIASRSPMSSTSNTMSGTPIPSITASLTSSRTASSTSTITATRSRSGSSTAAATNSPSNTVSGSRTPSNTLSPTFMPPAPGIAADLDYTATLGIVSATWTGAFSDPESVLTYRWWAGTTPGGSDVLQLQSVGTATSGRAAIGNILPDATVYVTVSATNTAGLSTNISSDGVQYDATPPLAGTLTVVGATAPPVMSGKSSPEWDPNIYFLDPAVAATAASSRSCLIVALAGFNTTIAPLRSFALAVGTSDQGADVVPATPAPPGGTVRVCGLALPMDVPLYISVTATQAAGVARTVSLPVRLELDSGPPTLRSITVSSLVNDYTLPVCIVAPSQPYSGIAAGYVRVAVGGAADATYSVQSDAPIAVPEWSQLSPSSLLALNGQPLCANVIVPRMSPGVPLAALVTLVSGAGSTATYASPAFTFDFTTPQLDTVGIPMQWLAQRASVAGGMVAIQVAWSAASDPASPGCAYTALVATTLIKVTAGIPDVATVPILNYSVTSGVALNASAVPATVPMLVANITLPSSPTASGALYIGIRATNSRGASIIVAAPMPFRYAALQATYAAITSVGAPVLRAGVALEGDYPLGTPRMLASTDVLTVLWNPPVVALAAVSDDIAQVDVQLVAWNVTSGGSLRGNTPTLTVDGIAAPSGLSGTVTVAVWRDWSAVVPGHAYTMAALALPGCAQVKARMRITTLSGYVVVIESPWSRIEEPPRGGFFSIVPSTYTQATPTVWVNAGLAAISFTLSPWDDATSVAYSWFAGTAPGRVDLMMPQSLALADARNVTLYGALAPGKSAPPGWDLAAYDGLVPVGWMLQWDVTGISWPFPSASTNAVPLYVTMEVVASGGTSVFVSSTGDGPVTSMVDLMNLNATGNAWLAQRPPAADGVTVWNTGVAGVSAAVQSNAAALTISWTLPLAVASGARSGNAYNDSTVTAPLDYVSVYASATPNGSMPLGPAVSMDAYYLYPVTTVSMVPLVPPGTVVYAVVSYFDVSGMSVTVASAPTVIDSTTPTPLTLLAPAVQGQGTSIAASWSFDSLHSGRELTYSAYLGTTPGSSDIAAPRSVGSARSFQWDSLTLRDGDVAYVTVVGCNAVGACGTISSAPGSGIVIASSPISGGRVGIFNSSFSMPPVTTATVTPSTAPTSTPSPSIIRVSPSHQGGNGSTLSSTATSSVTPRPSTSAIAVPPANGISATPVSTPSNAPASPTGVPVNSGAGGVGVFVNNTFTPWSTSSPAPSVPTPSATYTYSNYTINYDVSPTPSASRQTGGNTALQLPLPPKAASIRANQTITLAWDGYHVTWPVIIDHYTAVLGDGPGTANLGACDAPVSSDRRSCALTVIAQPPHGATVYATVTGFTNAGVATSVVSPGVVIDLTPPEPFTAATVYAVLQPPRTTLPCVWTASADTESGIAGYAVAVTATLGTTTVVSAWSALLSAQPPLAANVSAQVFPGAGSSFPPGVYTCGVRAYNGMGVFSDAWSQSTTIVDVTPPTAVGASVLDGPNPFSDAEFLTAGAGSAFSSASATSSSAQVMATNASTTSSTGCIDVPFTWNGFADAESDVAFFEAALASASTGVAAPDVVPWTRVRGYAGHTFACVRAAAADGTRLFAFVRATNLAGMVSIAVSSNGAVVDRTPPTVVSTQQDAIAAAASGAVAAAGGGSLNASSFGFMWALSGVLLGGNVPSAHAAAGLDSRLVVAPPIMTVSEPFGSPVATNNGMTCPLTAWPREVSIVTEGVDGVATTTDASMNASALGVFASLLTEALPSINVTLSSVCAPGAYRMSLGVCVPCAAGFFKAIAGDAACEACPAGTLDAIERSSQSVLSYSAAERYRTSEYRATADARTCRCIDATQEFVNAQTGCVCAAGYVPSDQQAALLEEARVRAAAGQSMVDGANSTNSSVAAPTMCTRLWGRAYKPFASDDATLVAECPNEAVPSPDYTSCLCPAARGFVLESQACECGPGMYLAPPSVGNASVEATCAQCPGNSYKPLAGNNRTACVPCPLGTITSPDSTTCVLDGYTFRAGGQLGRLPSRAPDTDISAASAAPPAQRNAPETTLAMSAGCPAGTAVAATAVERRIQGVLIMAATYVSSRSSTTTATGTATPSGTASPSMTASGSATGSAVSTATPSRSRTITGTGTASVSHVNSATVTSPATQSGTSTRTAAATATASGTLTGSMTMTQTSSHTSAISTSATVTRTATTTPSGTPAATPPSTASSSTAPSGTKTAGGTPTTTSTRTPTSTVSPPLTPTATATPSRTATATGSATATGAPSSSSSRTAASSLSTTQSTTASGTGSHTPVQTLTSSATSTTTSTVSHTATSSTTPSHTSTASTASPTATVSAATHTTSGTAQASATSSMTGSATLTKTATTTASQTASATASRTNTGTSTSTSTGAPTGTATATQTGSGTSTAASTNSMTATNSRAPSSSSSRTVTHTPSLTHTHTPGSTPTLTGTSSATATGTSSPSGSPAPPRLCVPPPIGATRDESAGGALRLADGSLLALGTPLFDPTAAAAVRLAAEQTNDTAALARLDDAPHVALDVGALLPSEVSGQPVDLGGAWSFVVVAEACDILLPGWSIECLPCEAGLVQPRFIPIPDNDAAAAASGGGPAAFCAQCPGLARGSYFAAASAELHLNWTGAFTDGNGSGIVSYAVAVGSVIGGSQVIPFTDVGAVTAVTLSAPHAPFGSPLFATLIAYDAAGNAGLLEDARPVFLDDTSPLGSLPIHGTPPDDYLPPYMQDKLKAAAAAAANVTGSGSVAPGGGSTQSASVATAYAALADLQRRNANATAIARR